MEPIGEIFQVIEFHHPAFDPKRKTTFPDIEQLLTEIKVNLELFDASRPAEGTFTKQELTDLHEKLLFTIAQWFHTLYENACMTLWLSEVIKRLKSENAAIVSFNWDLLLDQLLFEDKIGPQSYGLATVQYY